MPSPAPATEALILIDHGSRRAAANEMLVALVDRLRHRGQYSIVEPAHMELAEPDLKAAFSRCVEQGARRIVVVPYFLAPGSHASRDIPELAAEAAADHPGLAWRVAPPLGIDDRILDVVVDRARDTGDT